MQNSQRKFLFPQLPLPCSDPQPFATGNQFVAQEKFDGQRLVVAMRDGEFSAYDRIGIPRRRDRLREIVGALTRQIGSLDFTVDGEWVDDDYVLFDLLDLGGIDFSVAPYQDRLDQLSEAFFVGDNIRIAKTFWTAPEKVAAIEWLRERGTEGVVFKDRNAAYHSGRSYVDGPLFSFDFRNVAKCIVTQSIGRMIVVALIDASDGTRREVGRVNLEPYQPVPENGAIVDVRYRIALPIGQLFKPEFAAVRTDVNEDECLYSQLVFPAAAS